MGYHGGSSPYCASVSICNHANKNRLCTYELSRASMMVMCVYAALSTVLSDVVDL